MVRSTSARLTMPGGGGRHAARADA
jgi:hypothetical protein